MAKMEIPSSHRQSAFRPVRRRPAHRRARPRGDIQ